MKEAEIIVKNRIVKRQHATLSRFDINKIKNKNQLFLYVKDDIIKIIHRYIIMIHRVISNKTGTL